MLKVAVLYVIFEAIFIATHPLDRLLSQSLYGVVYPLRPRLIRYENDMSPQLVSLDLLLRSHEISQTKAPDEFRIVVLGDSGINGYGNTDAETISAYITASQQRIDGKLVHAYNLAIPNSSVTRDLLIANAALDYSPDMIVWFVTLAGLWHKDIDPVIAANPVQMDTLAARFQLDDLDTRAASQYHPSWWDGSFLLKRDKILQWLKFQTYPFKEHVYINAPSTALQADLRKPAESAKYNLASIKDLSHWASLRAASKLTTLPILIVNDPILVTPDTYTGSDVNYNSLYARQAYDDYRQALAGLCQDNNLWCLDIWDMVPAQEYTNTPLHRSAVGNSLLADRVAQELTAKFQH